MSYSIKKAWPRPMQGIMPLNDPYPDALHDLADDAMAILSRSEDEPPVRGHIDRSDLSVLIGMSLTLASEYIVYLQSIMLAVEDRGVVTALAYVGPGADPLDDASAARCRPLTFEEADSFSRCDDDIGAPYCGWNHETELPSWISRLPERMAWVRERHLLAAHALWLIETACERIDEGQIGAALKSVALAGTAVASGRYFIGWASADAQAIEDGGARGVGAASGARLDVRALGRLGGLKKTAGLARARRFVIETYESRSDWKSMSDFARIVRGEVMQIARSDNYPMSEINAERTIREWVRSAVSR